MRSRYGTSAHLVWDGTDDVRIPEVMGCPADGQMIGTRGERLSELAGRICYDSLGKGRSSADYHKHIQEVKHGSVYEHPHMTVFMKGDRDFTVCPEVFLNRPGVWVRLVDSGLRVTFNPRVLLDWDQFGFSMAIEKALLMYHAVREWPRILSGGSFETMPNLSDYSRIVEPDHDEERWVTLFVSGSRGMSHELVRHGDFTAISQRSTRFVQENESEWIDHPLVQEYDKHLAKTLSVRDAANFIERLWSVKDLAQKVYGEVVETLQPWLIEKGVDKFTARKQARGAARGYLGNALETQLIFSASVGQWKRMLRMRACDAADAEIRSVFVQALCELLNSRYGTCFTNWRALPAKDGIGETAVESPSVQV